MKRRLPADESGIVTDAILELTVNRSFRHCWTSERFQISDRQKAVLKAVLLNVDDEFRKYKGKHFD